MKFLKIMAVIMTICLLGTAMVACNNGGKDSETETEAATEVSIKVTLVLKDGSSEKLREEQTYKGTTPTLGKILEIYCAGEDYADPFDEQGLLASIGELKAGGGKNFIAYYEDEGESKAFDSIKDQVLTDGKTVVVVLK